jgi:nucleoid-associated protein YgaU
VQIKEKEPKLMPEPVTSRPVSLEPLAAPEPVIPRILETVPAVQEYTVKTGDSYWSIADHFYGDVQMWKILYEVNKDRMRNPDNPHLIFPGMVLTVPGFRG